MPRNAGHKIRHILIISAVLLLGACAPKLPPRLPDADHPLTEKIWSVAEQRFVTGEAVVAALAKARYGILGEAHDDPRHHALETFLLRAMVERNRHLTLVAEMIAADQANALKIFYEEPRTRADLLRLFLDWDKSGWPTWNFYAPIFNAAILGNYPIRAGNLDRRLLPALHERGWAAFDDAARRDLDLPSVLPKDVGPAIKAAIDKAHCNALPETVITHFAEIQFARDARMAKAMMTDPGADGAILIAGVDHARRDRAVPMQLKRLKARGTVVSVAFMETEPGKTDPAAYDLPYDYVWFTPARHRTAVCAGRP